MAFPDKRQDALALYREVARMQAKARSLAPKDVLPYYTDELKKLSLSAGDEALVLHMLTDVYTAGRMQQAAEDSHESAVQASRESGSKGAWIAGGFGLASVILTAVLARCGGSGAL